MKIKNSLIEKSYFKTTIQFFHFLIVLDFFQTQHEREIGQILRLQVLSHIKQIAYSLSFDLFDLLFWHVSLNAIFI